MSKTTKTAKTSKAKKASKTPESILAGWTADANNVTISLDRLDGMGWVAGNGHVAVDGLNYERFDVGGGKFCVVEWDADGNVVVL
jgi:hypothetical protein